MGPKTQSGLYQLRIGFHGCAPSIKDSPRPGHVQSTLVRRTEWICHVCEEQQDGICRVISCGIKCGIDIRTRIIICQRKQTTAVGHS